MAMVPRTEATVKAIQRRLPLLRLNPSTHLYIFTSLKVKVLDSVQFGGPTCAADLRAEFMVRDPGGMWGRLGHLPYPGALISNDMERPTPPKARARPPKNRSQVWSGLKTPSGKKQNTGMSAGCFLVYLYSC